MKKYIKSRNCRFELFKIKKIELNIKSKTNFREDYLNINRKEPIVVTVL